MKKNLKTVCCFLALFVSGLTSASTVGTLTYDNISGIITDSNTGTSYLGWDIAAPLTYAQTLQATSKGGMYEGYHIASQTEAFTFFHAFTGTAASAPDTAGNDLYTGMLTNLNAASFGQNYIDSLSWAWFLSDQAGMAGGIAAFNDGTYVLDDTFLDITITDDYSSDGQDFPITWLLVSDNNLSPVPVPAALPLFATALALFGWIRRRKLPERV